jgi:tRNA-dihydrouridine synthase 1
MTERKSDADCTESNVAMYAKAWDFYRKVGSPKFIVAPMVNQSECAFRYLCRKYKADLCVTPMFHARLFATEPAYRASNFGSQEGGEGDRPLVVQFCANDPNYLLQAAKFVEDRCDAVDINLGCPQGIAKKGHYGSFLLDEEWDLIVSMVRTLHENLKIPVTCKMRILPEFERTLDLARRIQDAGCSLLTVHGRTRQMIKQNLQQNDFDVIRRLKAALQIPVVSNGGIEHMEDINRALQVTSADGIMVSEALLGNPTLFASIPWTMGALKTVSVEYVELALEQNVPLSAIRGHLFKFLYPIVMKVPWFQQYLASTDREGIKQVPSKLEQIFSAENIAETYVISPTETWYKRHQAGTREDVAERLRLPKDQGQEKTCVACEKSLPRSSFSVRNFKHAKGRCLACSNPGSDTGMFQCPTCENKAPVFEAVWSHTLSTQHFYPVCAKVPGEFACAAKGCDLVVDNVKQFCRHVGRHHKDWVKRLCQAQAQGPVSPELVLALSEEVKLESGEASGEPIGADMQEEAMTCADVPGVETFAKSRTKTPREDADPGDAKRPKVDLT